MPWVSPITTPTASSPDVTARETGEQSCSPATGCRVTGPHPTNDLVSRDNKGSSTNREAADCSVTERQPSGHNPAYKSEESHEPGLVSPSSLSPKGELLSELTPKPPTSPTLTPSPKPVFCWTHYPEQSPEHQPKQNPAPVPPKPKPVAIASRFDRPGFDNPLFQRMWIELPQAYIEGYYVRRGYSDYGEQTRPVIGSRKRKKVRRASDGDERPRGHQKVFISNQQYSVPSPKANLPLSRQYQSAPEVNITSDQPPEAPKREESESPVKQSVQPRECTEPTTSERRPLVTPVQTAPPVDVIHIPCEPPFIFLMFDRKAVPVSSRTLEQGRHLIYIARTIFNT